MLIQVQISFYAPHHAYLDNSSKAYLFKVLIQLLFHLLLLCPDIAIDNSEKPSMIEEQIKYVQKASGWSPEPFITKQRSEKAIPATAISKKV